MVPKNQKRSSATRTRKRNNNNVGRVVSSNGANFKWLAARTAAAIFYASTLGVCFFLQAEGQQPPAQVPAAQTAQASSEESPNDLFVTVGKSLIINSELPIERVSVGFGDVAEATAVSPKEILVNGKAPGETSLIVWQEGGGKLFFDVTVQPSQFGNRSRIETLRRQLNTELPGQKIEPTVENDLIFLRGTVKDLTSADRALAIASALGKPVNLLYVNVPAPDAQILLKVKFASVDRNMLRQLGINIFSTGIANTIGTVTTGQFSPPALSSQLGSSGSGGSGGGVTGSGVTASISNFLNLFFFRPDLNIGATIQALEQRGVAEVLAEPNVLAENGKQASFLAGGEFPFPVVQGGNVGGSTAVAIQFRQFGVRLNFIPTVTPRGTIHLQVAPEVSTLDFANGVVLSGFTVPAVDVRNVNTEVELGEGQSFAIGGLLDNRESETFSKIPFIGSVPILGKFFQSKSKNRTNTELMVIVTPELVRPMSAGQTIATPNYPVPFLPPNSATPMATPGQNITGPVPVAAAPPVPVESLVKSYGERPLVVTSSSGYGGPQVAPSQAPLASPPAAAPAPSAPAPSAPASTPQP
jgi:pilus assembly protein CpaC